MFKKVLINALLIFIAWTIIDFLVHGLYLKEAYEQTASLWRPMEEAKMGLNAVVVLVVSLIFTLIYVLLIDRKSMSNALIFGLLLGISAGMSMGYGFYSFSPVPYHMAATWFVTSVVEGLVGGLILGLLAKN